jgi:hypothetical protein
VGRLGYADALGWLLLGCLVRPFGHGWAAS